MNTNDMNARIEAILADRVNFEILHRPGTLPATRRSYAFWWVSMMDAPKGSLEYKASKKKLRKLLDALTNESCAQVMREGIARNPSGE